MGQQESFSYYLLYACHDWLAEISSGFYPIPQIFARSVVTTDYYPKILFSEEQSLMVQPTS